ncbi:hypothetical protein [Alkalihalobacillus sp. AL-G]|uniref:hypothetical protein n=1 Tax=Alkalihalobacillus sp. AL-G TaxID=2926399 RepID=UPI00272BF054|nr:hypothetical protein [Alkalihalobacillus sp. AL-G]WLD94270.1 hypothetical protein MOJ78_05085 [Alkalihalobacillus sp. AL-G]
MLKLGFDHFTQIKKEIVEGTSKTFIQSFEDLCDLINIGKTVYFQTDDGYGTIKKSNESKVFITVASSNDVDQFEGTARKLQKIYFYLQGAFFIMHV